MLVLLKIVNYIYTIIINKTIEIMNSIIWKDNTITYENKDGEVVTKELEKYNGNKGFILSADYLKYTK